jgi:hypothetical protein
MTNRYHMSRRSYKRTNATLTIVTGVVCGIIIAVVLVKFFN